MITTIKKEIIHFLTNPYFFFVLNYQRIKYYFFTKERKYYPGYYVAKNFFKRKKIIFVHIPKTAGSSFSYSIFGKNILNHHNIRTYIDDFKNENLDDYFKCCFVRHPESRFISIYNYLKTKGTKDVGISGHQNLLKISDDYITNSSSINDFVKKIKDNSEVLNQGFLQPQVFLIKDNEGQIIMDFIGRVENFKEDFNYITSKIGLSVKLKTINVNKKKEDSILSNSTREFIEIFYAEDYEAFGYEKRSSIIN